MSTTGVPSPSQPTSYGDAIEQGILQGIAGKSPIGAAIYQAETHQSPYATGYTQNPGSPNIPAAIIAQIAGLYSRNKANAAQNNTTGMPRVPTGSASTPTNSSATAELNDNPFSQKPTPPVVSAPDNYGVAYQQTPSTQSPNPQQSLGVGFGTPSPFGFLAGTQSTGGIYSPSSGTPTGGNNGGTIPGNTSVGGSSGGTIPGNTSIGGDSGGDGSDGPEGPNQGSGLGGTPVLIDPSTGLPYQPPPTELPYQGSTPPPTLPPFDPGDGGGDGGGGGKDPSPGDSSDAYAQSMAQGGFLPEPGIARIGESGPEAVGGHIITQPSIVKLNKGESVVPLTPRANNKLQPDLLEGHIGAPKVPGLNFSRYKAYGTGRGLMR